MSQRVKLKRSGKNYSGLCPFHEDRSPSFYVSNTTGRYTCFSCKETGDIFTWVMKTEGLDFIEALRKLAEIAGVALTGQSTKQDRSEKERWLAAMEHALKFFREQFTKSDLAQNYCSNRGLELETINTWEIGFAPSVDYALAQNLNKAGFSLAECQKLFLVSEDYNGGFTDKFKGRLMFPIRDERSELVGFGGRIIGDGQPKYINSGDTPLYRKSRVLYGYHRAKDRMMKDGRAVLVEGYIDVIACHKAGVTNAVASLGTSLTEEQAKLMKRFCGDVSILYDSDKAGQKAAGKAIEILASAGIRSRVALMPEGEDPDTLLRRDGAEAVRNAVERGITPLDFEVQSLEKSSDMTDPDFWQRIVEVLAGAQSAQEIEKHILRLAGQHPDIRTPSAAERALRQDIARIRRAKSPKANAPAAPSSQGSSPQPALPLHPWEAAVFHSMLSPTLREEAWPIATDPTLMLTGRAAHVAESLAASFTTAPKQDSVHWLHLIEDTDVQTLLAELEFTVDANAVNQANLQGAIARLKEKKHEKETRAIKDQAGDKDSSDLRAIQKRLQDKLRLKGALPEDDKESLF